MDTDSDIVRAAAGLCKELNYDLTGNGQDMKGFTGDLNKFKARTRVYTFVSDAAIRAALMTQEQSQPTAR